jgi:hypothetical protein
MYIVYPSKPFYLTEGPSVDLLPGSEPLTPSTEYIHS